MKILAAASGVMAAPGLVAAACKHGEKQAPVASVSLRGTGLVVSFSDAPASGKTRQVIITNTSDNIVKLTHVYPGVVSTPQGSYDLNSLLVNGSREFAPREATTLSIDPVKTASAEYPAPPASTLETWISVRTRDSRPNSGQHVKTVRHRYS